MRKTWCLALVLSLAPGMAGVSRTEESAGPRAIIDKAVQAAGGEAKLAQFKAHTWTEKGTYYGMSDGLPYTGKYAVQWPDRFSMEIEGFFKMVVNGDQGWSKGGDGNTMEMSKEQLAEHKETNLGGYIATLLPLKDKAFTLTPLPEAKVDGHPAVGVQVSHKGHRDVKLYFANDTGLLVKSEQTVKAQEQEGKEVRQEAYLSNYKEVAGAKMPMKGIIKRDGKLYVEAENSDVKPAAKLDDKLFAKP